MREKNDAKVARFETATISAVKVSKFRVVCVNMCKGILPSSCLWKHQVSFPRQHLKRNIYIVKSISNLTFDLIRRFEHLEFQIFRITILRV